MNLTTKVLVGVFFLCNLAVADTTEILSVAADSHVEESNKRVNYGSATNLKLSGSPRQLAFIRFNLNDIVSEENLKRAVLKLNVNSSDISSTIKISPAKSAWVEGTIVWVGRPVVNSPSVKQGISRSTNTVALEVDVTKIVEKWLDGTNPNYGFRLLTTGAINSEIPSKESGSVLQPKLILTFEGGTTDEGGTIGGGGGTGGTSGGGSTEAGTNLQSLDKVRFIGTGGNDNNNGLTHATRWATTNKATNLPTGTDVYILAGSDNGKRTFDIDWSGTESDRAIIGCYYIDTANSNRATSCEQGSMANSVTKPIIRGTYESSCRPPDRDYLGNVYRVASTCPYNTAGAVPSKTLSGLISAKGQRYITIQDLQVRNSSGSGVLITENATIPSRAIIQRLRIDMIAARAIDIDQVAENSRAIVRDNVISFVALRYVDKRANKWNACVRTSSKYSRVASRTLFENNILVNCGGEGFNSLRTDYNIYRRNIIGSNRRTTMYSDNASYNIYENNLLIGGGFLGRQYNAGGPSNTIAVEPYDKTTEVPPKDVDETGSSIENVFRNNIAVSFSNGLVFRMTNDSKFNCGTVCVDPSTRGYKVGGYSYGNTIINREPRVNSRGANIGDFYIASNRWKVGNYVNIDKVVIKNNMFAGISSCGISESDGAMSQFSIGNNLYQRSPTTDACKGSGDVYNYLPISIQLLNENAQTFLNEDYTPKTSKMQIIALSGYNTTKSVPNDIPQLNASDYPQIEDFQDGKCKISSSEWVKPLSFDFYCNARNSPGRPGAIETGSTP